MMTKRRRKPEGLDNFQRLLKPLSKVPKAQLDREAEKYEARKAKKKQKS
jgi:hypothetical protein